MQTARRIVKSIFRDIFITCLILGVFGAVTVSYTHLDVYKRQPYPCIQIGGAAR